MAEGKLPLAAFVDAARGTVPADLVFRNARVVNVLTGEIHEETVGVAGDRVLAGRPPQRFDESDQGRKRRAELVARIGDEVGE